MKKMSKFIKNNFKGIIIGTIIGILLCGTIGVMAITYFPSNDVTYDNKESGLSSTNVQGAIDELYGICFPSVGNQILEKVPIVTTGDGLYKDEYEEGRYFYKGANPNNYISFNNELWRILSIEKDGTIKIISTNNENFKNFDSNSNNWAKPSDLNKYLNEEYLSTLINQEIIVNHKFSIGYVTKDNNNLLEQIKSENKNTWTGKIGLITVSEYLRTNSNISSCNSLHKNNITYNYICSQSNWQYNIHINSSWTISPASGNFIYRIDEGTVELSTTQMAGTVIPTLYLSSNIQISGGNGTQNSPYTYTIE